MLQLITNNARFFHLTVRDEVRFLLIIHRDDISNHLDIVGASDELTELEALALIHDGIVVYSGANSLVGVKGETDGKNIFKVTTNATH